jgi:hypothetical protein
MNEKLKFKNLKRLRSLIINFKPGEVMTCLVFLANDAPNLNELKMLSHAMKILRFYLQSVSFELYFWEIHMFLTTAFLTWLIFRNSFYGPP